MKKTTNDEMKGLSQFLDDMIELSNSKKNTSTSLSSKYQNYEEDNSLIVKPEYENEYNELVGLFSFVQDIYELYDNHVLRDSEIVIVKNRAKELKNDYETLLKIEYVKDFFTNLDLITDLNTIEKSNINEIFNSTMNFAYKNLCEKTNASKFLKEFFI